MSAAAPHLKQNCDGAAWAKALHAGTEAMKRSVTQVLAEYTELFSFILWYSQYKMCQTVNFVNISLCSNRYGGAEPGDRTMV